jgi:hypothetical protein
MQTDVWLVALLAAWPLIGGWLLYDAWRDRRPGVGLLLAYFLSMSILHWFGGLIYALPWYDGADPDLVAIGFQQGTLGLAAFALGALVLGPRLVKAAPAAFPEAPRFVTHRLTPAIYCLLGVFFYVVMAPVLSGVPSIRTFVWSGWSLLVAGICLGSWQAWQRRNRPAMLGWALASLAPGVWMLVRDGFLSYGIAVLTVVTMFVARYFRPRWLLLAAGLVGAYGGLSLFVTYLRDRDEMRALLWFQEGGEFSSVSFFSDMFNRFEWFDAANEEHLFRINLRLNQNMLVGTAVKYMEGGGEDYARGETFRYALEAMVPRLIWPEKTVTAGSMGLVSRFTGITFGEDTSVGMGQVLEFYVNFGTASVVVGFLLLGMVIRFVDEACGNRLARGDWRGFVTWFVPALALLQAGGALVEVTGGAAAGLVFTMILHLLMPRLQTALPEEDPAPLAAGLGTAVP